MGWDCHCKLLPCWRSSTACWPACLNGAAALPLPRRCCREVSERYPEIEYEEMIVDNTCMQVCASGVK